MAAWSSTGTSSECRSTPPEVEAELPGCWLDLGPHRRPLAGPLEPFVPSDLFGNDHPVALDIGCGKGFFLLRESQRRRDVNFVGIEWARKYARWAAARIVRNGLVNVRIVSADVRTLLPRFPGRSIQAAHVYFPDPWWKQRHHKRRLFVPEFVAELARVLMPGGSLFLATDVADYFALMQEVVGQQPEFERCSQPAPQDASENQLDYLTHFDRKYRQEGRAIHRAAYRRRQ